MKAPLPARRWLTAGALAAVGLGGLVGVVLAAQAKPGGPSEPPPVPVQVVRAQTQDVPHVFEAVGTVESLQSVVVRTQVDGILTQVAFREGDMVRARQLLATIDDRALRAALEAAEAQLARDEAQLRLAELNLGRYRTLLDRNAIARQSVDQQSAEVDQVRATVRLDRANLEAARVNLSYTRILSPVTGRAGIRRVDPGNLVRTADADGLVSITQVNPISVIFSAPQQVLGAIRETAGHHQGGFVEVVDREAGVVLRHGRITAFDNGIDAANGTSRVRAQFLNADERLIPGAFVAVRVRTGQSNGATTVPAAAVRPGLEGQYVYVVREGAAQRSTVEVAYADDRIAAISKGVAPGDLVVTDGYSRLKPGAKVTTRPAPATSQAASAAAGMGG
ncbi:efflux RND transporter periplasmic adaptor subunit [Phenylobacterium sp. LjRoot225]|uniref:efflux RND transporter periplasmic adaptor subunit n=1 Tax=Phenylobacterium sp. LjRoot225 TaxID=3342285 RepID=UPI003ECC89C7